MGNISIKIVYTYTIYLVSFVQQLYYLEPLEPSLTATSCLLPLPFKANLDRCLRTSDCSAFS